MYLSSNQHDSLRTLTMAFEIPYRSYISDTLINKFPTKSSFSSSLAGIDIATLSSGNPGLHGQLVALQNNSGKIFDALSFAKNSFDTMHVSGENDVPMLGQLNTLTLVYQSDFSQLINLFPDFSTFFVLAKKYAYVRNKLNHPLCKVLEYDDMGPALNFIEEISKWLDQKYFWDKSRSEILKRTTALRTGSINIPIQIHNIPEMPFPDMRIVCREKETASIKEFVYGKPGAFRKQCSLCIYGYGGLGKTALVLETIKQIIQDTIDGTTVNGYRPEFLLFFTAKDRKLTFSQTAGTINSVGIRKSFDTFVNLKTLIFNAFNIDSFVGFSKVGIIVIDNLETLSSSDRDLLHNFIQSESPPCIQYILTSRKEEQYDVNQELNGFEDASANFIDEYIDENDLNLSLSPSDKNDLLQLSKGNTLVLVLCLCRLSHKLETVDSIKADFSKLPTAQTFRSELSQLPPSGFDIISEFMFKNTFEEVEALFSSDNADMYEILQVFTVYDEDDIDIYAISMITQIPCQTVQRIANILCHYLILERNGPNYSLNQFAEKYIIQRFFPDSVQYEELQDRVKNSIRQTQVQLDAFDADLAKNPDRMKILKDWNIVTSGDKIAAAKIDAIYVDVREQCSKGSKFFVQAALQDAMPKIVMLEKTSMHPYIQYQKARILKRIDDSNILPEKHDSEIMDVYKNVIWTIKNNNLYSSIRHTKSYASILWIYGMRLIPEDAGTATRNLEDAQIIFEECDLVNSTEYSNCLTALLHSYLENYGQTRIKGYLHKARGLDRKIMEMPNKSKYFWQYHGQLQQY